ncbi:MAG: serine aminopeptidase domain-containing protein [Myxococcota bacterium]
MAKREERAVTIPLEGGELALDGLYIAGEDTDAVGVVVAAPHPLYGGSMDSPVVNEIAYAAREAGLASLRFDWRGVGASGGAASGDAAAAAADYRAALDHLTATVSGAVCAAGYSFGAAAAVRAAAGEPRVRRLLLLAPPPAFLDREALAAFGGEVCVAVGAEDALAPAAELEEIVASLRRGKFQSIPEADHFFGAGLAAVGRFARESLAH